MNMKVPVSIGGLEQPEAGSLFYRDGWRDREFLAMNGNFDQRRPVVGP
jgi:hypothetical protein